MDINLMIGKRQQLGGSVPGLAIVYGFLGIRFSQ